MIEYYGSTPGGPCLAFGNLQQKTTHPQDRSQLKHDLRVLSALGPVDEKDA